jgi:hypothetical protein
MLLCSQGFHFLRIRIVRNPTVMPTWNNMGGSLDTGHGTEAYRRLAGKGSLQRSPAAAWRMGEHDRFVPGSEWERKTYSVALRTTRFLPRRSFQTTELEPSVPLNGGEIPPLSSDSDRRAMKRSRIKVGCRQNWPPHKLGYHRTRSNASIKKNSPHITDSSTPNPLCT